MNLTDNVHSATDGHIFHRFDDEMRALIILVVNMSELVSEQIAEIGKAIKKGDVEHAKRVLELEKKVDAFDDAIEDEIHRILALRQPMASDLRVLLTVNRLGSYLERIGDQARGIANLAIKLFRDGTAPDKELLNGIPRMAKFVGAMVDLSIRAFQNMDVELALEVIEMDRDLNDQFDAAVRSLTTYMLEDPRRIGESIQVVLALRSLDRMGGHSKSIGRQVIFMVRGIKVRHQSAESLAVEIRSGDDSR